MNVADEIRKLGDQFGTRLDAAILADALQYLDFNEWGLALEMLADKLRDQGILVSAKECDKFDELAVKVQDVVPEK